MTKWIRIVASATLAVLTVGAWAAGERGGELTAWERFKAYAHHEKEMAVKEGRKLIAATDKQIAEMKQKAKASGHEPQAAWKENVQALETKKKAAQSELDKMAQASTTAWDATKEGFANAYKDLHEAYDKARAPAKK